MKRRSTAAALSRTSIFMIAVTVLAASNSAVAEENEEGLPIWEVGIGLFPSTYPAYRGSGDQQSYVLPFPYLRYRGDILKIDRDGIRAELFDSERVELNISMNGAVPAKSDANGPREGMPDLDAAFEIGPSLDFIVARLSPRQSLRIRLPVRSVIVTDLRDVDLEGWVFNPHLNWDQDGGMDGWDAGLSVGPLFATRKYHEYYYDVAPQYATSTRPVYSASAGYSGATAVASMSRRFGRIWVGGFMRYDYLAGAAFEDSPLVETDHALMGGIAVAWVFAISGETVSAETFDR